MLVCADLARSRDFYRDVIGLKVGIDEPPHWVDFPLGGGIELGLHPVSDEMSLQPGSMSLGFAVDDVDAAIAGMKSKGVRVLSEPREQTFGRLAIIADPDGYSVQLVTPKHWG